MNDTAIRNTTASRGFTLIELVVTISIAAVLITLAAPAFRDYMANQRIRNASFDMVASIAFARSEAITRNAAVNIVPVSADVHWENGWSVRAIVGGTDTALRTQSAYSNLSITANLAQLTYGRDGRPSASFTTTIAPSTTLSGVTCRVISVSLGGTANSATVACP